MLHHLIFFFSFYRTHRIHGDHSKKNFSDLANFHDSHNSNNHPKNQSTNQRTLGGDMRSCEVRINPTGGNFINRWLASFPNRSKRIDVVSRICFPTMFGMFNVVYWTVYLLREDLRDNLIKK